MNNTSTVTKSFRIPYNIRGWVVARIREVSDKAARRGLEWTPTLEWGNISMSGDIRFIEAKISYPEIDLGGYTVVGFANLLNVDQSGRAVCHPLGSRSIPANLREVSDECDHCGKRRRRNFVYVLVDECENFSVVGSSCLQKLLPQTDLGIVHHLEALEKWGQNVTEGKNKKVLKAAEVTIDVAQYLADRLPESYDDLSIMLDWAASQTRDDDWSSNIRAIAEERFLTWKAIHREHKTILSIVKGFQLEQKGVLDQYIKAHLAKREAHFQYYVGKLGQRIEGDFVCQGRSGYRLIGTIDGKRVVLAGIDEKLRKIQQTSKIRLRATVGTQKVSAKGNAYTLLRRIHLPD